MSRFLIPIAIGSILFFPISASLSILIGIVISVFIEYRKLDVETGRYTSYTSNVLKIAIVGLGFGISLNSALEVSKDGFILTLSTVIGVLVLGYVIARFIKLDNKISKLISSGTAICGGSAIAAVAPSVNANSNQIGISLGVVFLFNAFALLIFPYVGSALDMTQFQFGLWSAIAIHDTSSVVGAASIYGNEALETATTVKLARALWIIPVSLFFGLISSGKNKAKIPVFIILFVVAILANHFFEIPDNITSTIQYLAKKLMVVAIFLVGLGISIDYIRKIGFKPFGLGLTLWVLISVGSAIWILSL